MQNNNPTEIIGRKTAQTTSRHQSQLDCPSAENIVETPAKTNEERGDFSLALSCPFSHRSFGQPIYRSTVKIKYIYLHEDNQRT